MNAASTRAVAGILGATAILCVLFLATPISRWWYMRRLRIRGRTVTPETALQEIERGNGRLVEIPASLCEWWLLDTSIVVANPPSTQTLRITNRMLRSSDEKGCYGSTCNGDEGTDITPELVERQGMAIYPIDRDTIVRLRGIEGTIVVDNSTFYAFPGNEDAISKQKRIIEKRTDSETR